MDSKQASFKPNTEIGQNFLVDNNILDRIIAAAEISGTDILLEIGAGNGVLTKRLLSACPSLLHTVEIDRRLAPFLEPLTTNPAVSLIWGDVLKISLAEKLVPPPVKLVANLPYHITTPVIWKILEELAPRGLRMMILMVQKEAADRLACPKPGKNRSPLGITLQAMGSVERLFEVPPEAFRPSPKVNSSVICVELYQSFELALDEQWRELLRHSFGQRRKTLFNNLKGWLGSQGIDAGKLLDTLHWDPRVRAEELLGENWERLNNEINMKRGCL
jgi:16S rRNA (adenine1518-N6/adenine1519-N6)-dimethyltransferase